MIEIAVNNLAAATGARTVTGEADRVCRGCVIDSRQVEEGTIFVAFLGEKVDGNDFASRAIESGAGAVVMTREPDAELLSLAHEKGCAILHTDDPEEIFAAPGSRLSFGAWLPGNWHYRLYRQDNDQGRARRGARQALSRLGNQG